MSFTFGVAMFSKNIYNTEAALFRVNRDENCYSYIISVHRFVCSDSSRICEKR